jgi:cytochrome b
MLEPRTSSPGPHYDLGYMPYSAWDVPTRLFHWINALAVLGLIATGLALLYDDALLSTSGKINLKSLHASFGYVMGINLLWRFVWAFFGNRYARWRAILPGGQGYLASLRAYVSAFLSGEPQHYVGHNPLGRISVTLLLALLLVQAITGPVIAGMDLFWPPFGHWFAQWVAAPGIDPSVIKPGIPELLDKPAYLAMRSFRAPFVEIHEYTFYLLAMAIFVHLAAVIVTELREGGSLISAMFTGQKILNKKPLD